MTGSIGKLALQLGADSAALKADLDRAAQKVDSFGGSVRGKMNKLGDQIAQEKLASAPFNARREAGLTAALDNAKQARQKALDAEFFKMGRFDLMKEKPGEKESKKGAAGGLGSMLGTAATAGLAALIAKISIGFARDAVAKTSPATSDRFNRALDDLIAVIGRDLVPVIKLATDVIRKAADLTAGYQKMGGSVGLGTRAGQIMGNTNLGPGGSFGLAISEWFNKSNGASVGAAVHPARFVGAEELSRENILKGFSDRNVPEQQLDVMKQVLDAIKAGNEAIEREQRARASREAINGFP